MCAGSEASCNILSFIRISVLSYENKTMTAIDRHSMIGDSNCTNFTIPMVKCECAAAVVAAGVDALAVLQKDQCLKHVAILSLLL